MALRHLAFILACLLVPGTGASQTAAWLETEIAIEGLIEARDFEAAAELGETLLESVRNEFGASSEQLAEAHALLASVYRSDSDYVEAEFQLLRAIEIREGNEGPLSTRLIEPLVTLGETYHDAGSYPLALASYEEARTIGRRAFGLLNLDQIPILDKMTASALAMRDFEEARALQREAMTVAQRFHGDASVEYLDAQYRYARWLVDNYRLDDARRAYFAIDRDIGDRFDDDPRLRVRHLRTTSADFRNVGRPFYGTDPSDLNRALKIVDDLEEPDPLLRAEVLRDIGDWNVAFQASRDLTEPYIEAWEILGQIENGEDLRRQWFSGLVMVRSAPFNTRILSGDENAPRGRIELAFTIDDEGRPSSISVVSSDPPGLFDSAAIQQVAASRFRPRIVGGRVVASTGRVGYDFRYDPRYDERFRSAEASGD